MLWKTTRQAGAGGAPPAADRYETASGARSLRAPAGPLVALAIMSRWRDGALRDTLKRTWLSDLDAPAVQYRFFVEYELLMWHNVTLGPDGSDGELVGLKATRGQGAWFNNTEQVRTGGGCGM